MQLLFLLLHFVCFLFLQLRSYLAPPSDLVKSEISFVARPTTHTERERERERKREREGEREREKERKGERKRERGKRRKEERGLRPTTAASSPFFSS